MWITSIIINDSIDREHAVRQTLDFSNFITALLADGLETSNRVLPPYESNLSRMAAFGPGNVYKRAWDLESSARAAVDFINNHPNKQMTATFDGEQDI
jgi:hypothetical protein